MKWDIILRSKAEQDLEQAALWYEQQRTGLGAEFLAEVELALDRIGRHPEAHAMVYREARRELVRRFPYQIYYQILEDAVSILAVVHSSRNPKVWRDRVHDD